MLASEIITLARDITNTNTSTLPSVDGLRWLNRAYFNRIIDILGIETDKNTCINKSKTDLISTVGLVEGEIGYGGEYPMPSDIIKPIRFEISYDGKTWNKAKTYDNNANIYSEYNTEQINYVFNQSFPMVDYNRDSYFTRPIKNTDGDIVNGIYIEYEARQDALTESSEPIIEPYVQDVLAYDIATFESMKHAKKYDANWTQVFLMNKKNAEDRFKDHYKDKITSTKKITINYSNYA